MKAKKFAILCDLLKGKLVLETFKCSPTDERRVLLKESSTIFQDEFLNG